MDKRKEQNRKYNLHYNYGLSVYDYDKLLEEQNHKCKLCGTDTPCQDNDIGRFQVDHCHKTGRVRGLLCNRCNVCLGGFEAHLVRLEKVIDYLGLNLRVEKY